MSDPDRHPMPVTDQHGRTAYAWFPPGTDADPIHILPWDVYAAVCRLRFVDARSPRVTFRSRAEAVAALAAASRDSDGADRGDSPPT